MSDARGVVERLRGWEHVVGDLKAVPKGLCEEAATEIERLTREVTIQKELKWKKAKEAIETWLRLDELTQELEEARAAIEWCAGHLWEGRDIDGGDFQDEMVRRGLMVRVSVPEEMQAECDEWFNLAWCIGGGK